AKLELTTGAYYINSIENTDDTYHSIINRSSTNYPYLRYADDSGNPLAINRYFREQFISGALDQGFLDWGFRPLQELGLTKNTAKNTDYRLLTSLRYQLLSGLFVNLKYQYQKTDINGRVLHPAESYAARNLVNQYAILSGQQVVGYNVPEG